MTRVHVVPHTHWDREWYRPFQGFRMSLVDVLDRVLALLDADPGFAFTLDGQVAIVDDYLEIRPEAEARIRAHVEAGRLAIGPWLILPDEFLVSGESLVRNLEMGWRRAEELGGPMRAGYLPDMFGHVAQMPQILRRAGLADAVVWRGVPAAIDHHAFRWESADGSAVRAEYLVGGYDNAVALDAAGLVRLTDAARPWFGTDPVLAMAGTDHSAPVAGRPPDAPDVRIGTLAGYLADAPSLPPDAPSWRGELRSGARANLLMGVTSARIDVKRAAARAERRLERYAEPLFALHVVPDAWPEPFLRLAWRRAIESSAHDSICGSSSDAVVDQVLVRFAEAEQIASALAQRAAAAVATAVTRGALAVLNPSPVPRTGLVEAELRVHDEWADVALELPDGRRIVTQELSRKETILLETDLRGDEVDDLFRRFHGREVFDHAWNGYRIDGRTLTLEVDDEPDPADLEVEDLRAAVTAALSAATDETWRVRIVASPRRTLAASVPAPALGWTAVRPVEGSGEVPGNAVRVADRSLSNGLVTVSVNGDGTLRIAAADGTVADGVGRIVDGGDFGDAYNHAPPAADTFVDAPRDVVVRADLAGPVRGRLIVDRAYDWPAFLEADGSARSAGTVATEVRMEVELRADEPFVRIGLAFDNRSNDHRVRFAATLPRRTDGSHAEGQFAVVRRGLTAEGGYREEPLPTFPARGWVDAGGLAVLLDHVTEYELTDGGGELALTVLRSIGLISRRANPYRLDPAGPELPIPDAQMRGPWRMGFGLLVHADDWDAAGVADAAERYAHGFVTAPGRAERTGSWPPDDAGDETLSLEGGNVVLASLRRRPEGWLEARIVNLAAEPAVTTLRGELTEAREATLLGERGRALAVAAGALRLELGPAEIRTVQLRRRERAVALPPFVNVGGPRENA